jgi:hypothetical protein
VVTLFVRTEEVVNWEAARTVKLPLTAEKVEPVKVEYRTSPEVIVEPERVL